MTHASSIFLLGGQDLEMTEIRKLLETNGLTYHDRTLHWDSAKLSAYAMHTPITHKNSINTTYQHRNKYPNYE